jgi:hypothetical protein
VLRPRSLDELQAAEGARPNKLYMGACLAKPGEFMRHIQRRNVSPTRNSPELLAGVRPSERADNGHTQEKAAERRLPIVTTTVNCWDYPPFGISERFCVAFVMYPAGSFWNIGTPAIPPNM